MFNYSSPSVKNSALLALASIPHKLAGRLIFGIWCRAGLLFLLSSVGLLALARSTHTHGQSQIHTQIPMMHHVCQFCKWDLPTEMLGFRPQPRSQQVSRFSTIVLYKLEQPNQLQSATHKYSKMPDLVLRKQNVSIEHLLLSADFTVYFIDFLASLELFSCWRWMEPG